MSYLRKAVETQRNNLIKLLIEEGAYSEQDANIYNKSIDELLKDYKLRNIAVDK